MKAAAAVLVLLAVVAPAAHAQCDQCAPLDASNTFIAWSGVPAAHAPVTFAVQTVNGFTSCLFYERSWNFGDGTTSTEQMPAHVFAAPGTYTVSVTMTTLAGCNPPQSFGLSAAVTVETTCETGCPPVLPVNAWITWSDASGDCKPVAGMCRTSTPIVFTIATLGANFACRVYSFQWDFGDGTTSNTLTTTHAYRSVGTYAVSVTITGSDPCTPPFTIKQAVTVNVSVNRPGRRRSCCGH